MRYLRRFKFWNNIGLSLPVYVTRKTASGHIVEYSQAIWQTFLAMLLVWANIVVWGVIGLIKAFGILF
jgi:hypothetical protein